MNPLETEALANFDLGLTVWEDGYTIIAYHHGVPQNPCVMSILFNEPLNEEQQLLKDLGDMITRWFNDKER